MPTTIHPVGVGPFPAPAGVTTTYAVTVDPIGRHRLNNVFWWLGVILAGIMLIGMSACVSGCLIGVGVVGGRYSGTVSSVTIPSVTVPIPGVSTTPGTTTSAPPSPSAAPLAGTPSASTAPGVAIPAAIAVTLGGHVDVSGRPLSAPTERPDDGARRLIDELNGRP